MSRTSHITVAVMLAMTACHNSELEPTDGADVGAPPDMLPTDPLAFRVQLAGGPCFGSCPTYEVSVDQGGNVGIFAERCAPRPGVFTHKVPAGDARFVYDALMATPYATLGEHYRTMADGCERVFTDGPTYDWSVTADGQEKTLERYRGCEGIPALEEVDAVMSVMLERSDTRRFIDETVFNCDYGTANLADMSLRLSHAGAPVAMLKITKDDMRSGRFVIEDCAGNELARGEPVLESRRWLLIDERREPIALPEGLGDAGSLVLSRWPAEADAAPITAFKTTVVRAFLADGELEFSFEEAARCSD